MTKAVIIKKPETICSANQWTGFCMITVSVMKELMIYFFAFQKALLWKAHFSYRSSAVFSLTRLISWIVNRLHRGSFKKYIRSNLAFTPLSPLYAFIRFEKTPSSFVHFMYIFMHNMNCMSFFNKIIIIVVPVSFRRRPSDITHALIIFICKS